MSPPLHVTPVADDEVDAAYEVLLEVGEAIERAGRSQRIAGTKPERYRQWQAAGANHAIRDETGIVGVFTVVEEVLEDWPDAGIEGPVPMLRALATRPCARGRDVGRAGVRAALRVVAGRPLYLDCVSGFLPGYYESLGFVTLARQTRVFLREGLLDITLMRHDNDGAGA